MCTHRSQSQSGSAMIMAVVILVVMAAMAAALSRMHQGGVGVSVEGLKGTEGLALALAGMERGLIDLQGAGCAVPATNGQEFTVAGSGSFDYTITDGSGSGLFTIVANGYLPNRAAADGYLRRVKREDAGCAPQDSGDLFADSNEWNHPGKIADSVLTCSGGGECIKANNTNSANDHLTFCPLPQGQPLTFRLTYTSDKAVPLVLTVRDLGPGPGIQGSVTMMGDGAPHTVVLDFGSFDPQTIKNLSIDATDPGPPPQVNYGISEFCVGGLNGCFACEPAMSWEASRWCEMDPFTDQCI